MKCECGGTFEDGECSGCGRKKGRKKRVTVINGRSNIYRKASELNARKSVIVDLSDVTDVDTFLAEFEFLLMIIALQRNDEHVGSAAASIGLNRTTFHERLKRHIDRRFPKESQLNIR